MRSLPSWVKTAFIGCGALSALLAGTAPTVAASPPSAVASGLCGPGYRVIDTYDFVQDDRPRATVYLTYNAAQKKVCTVNLRPSYGPALHLSAYVQAEEGERVANAGQFHLYAGPARSGAGDGCVRWGGQYRTLQWHAQAPLTADAAAWCPASRWAPYHEAS
ncbi:hypothetical protein [Streptomyces beijiangensis]|uniref:Uncharacterized protein n=1 Tax=Streptomyces beijiangensis TaxID=163361 RepID=A0A939F2V0_9ACTN|nr:hypothetical protein [Streptomyces beijiangensis]MBO0510729.1 hypothetical protein [Streptomyces beijiangensis]